ncbi:catalase [Oryzisolibacter propanilivorax]|uniref:Catalase-related peroxidase n=1 Tax=Oryzisolibacter propanilivorax TaxID=1527607 RepID=A0A1G9VJD6_9BURK|nr:catalase family peroxidase [Oryzisolibacter propanilivorax]SDM72216.1 catalase [Oryzisolibacter propanilivorax]
MPHPTLLRRGTAMATATAALLLAGCAQTGGGAAARDDTDPTALVNQLEASTGKFAGQRRSGAKGICAAGEFIGSEQARALSTASAFSGRAVPVLARFSVVGANPKAPDNTRTQRNLALQFDLPGGEQWQMGNISSPVFGAATPAQFLGRLQSLQPDPATGKPDPTRVKAFADANPEVLLQAKYLAAQPVPASFAAVNYWGVHAFGFVDAQGRTHWGKWLFEPVGGTQGLSDEEARARGAQFLFADLRERVRQGRAAFDFNLELAEAGDRLDSPVVPLPADRRKVNLGRLTITSVAADDSGAGPCAAPTFVPLVLPRGVVASADPMLAARAAPYAISQGRRLAEPPAR